MKFLQSRKHSFFKKTMVCLLMILLLIQPSVFALPLDADNALSPVLYYNGEALADGMEIPENASLSAHYTFEADLSELSDTDRTLSLPSPLVAAYEGSIDIMGTDSSGNEYNVGNLTAYSDRGFVINFPSYPGDVNESLSVNDDTGTVPDNNEGPLPGDDEMTLPDNNEGALLNDEDVLTPTDEDTLSDNEGALSGEDNNTMFLDNQIITVNFAIPCTFDPQQIPQTMGESRKLSLMSGGRMVTVILVPASKPLVLTNMFAASPNLPLADAVTITDVTLEKEDAHGDYIYINQNDTIFSADTLKLTHYFYITEEQSDAIRALVQSGSNPTYSVDFDVSLPQGLICPGGESEDIFVTLPDGSKLQFAELFVDPDGDGVHLRFTGDFWYSGETSIDDAYVYVLCKLDMKEIGNAEEYTILLGSESLTINVGNNEERLPELSKGVVYSENEFTWKITYTPGTKDTGPITFTDTFQHEMQSFIYGSPRLDTNTSDYELNYVYTPDNDTAAITFTVTGQSENAFSPDKPIVITYKTTLTAAAFSEANYDTDTTVENLVSVNSPYYIGNDAQAFYTVTAAEKPKSWLKKAVTDPSTGNTITIEGKTIHWKVTVTTWEFGLESLVLHDTIPVGLTLDDSSIKIDGEAPAVGSYTVTNDVNGTTFDLTIPKENGKYKKSYVVTYSTTINDDHLTRVDANGNLIIIGSGSDQGFTNRAWLTFQWPPGYGKAPEPTVELVGIGVNNHIIVKGVAVTYNPSNQTISWKVTVNPHQMNIIGGRITDNLQDIGLDYVANSFSSNNALVYFNSYDTGVLTVGVGNLGENKAEFTFQTKVTDPLVYAYNLAEKSYKNTAVFDGKVLINNTMEVPVKDTATASAKVTSTVLEKKSLGYDYNDNTIQWQITVNKNKMTMPDAVLVDTIPQYQEFVAGSVSIDAAAAPPEKVSLVENVDGSAKLTVNLGDLTTQVIVTYKTKVLVDENPLFTNASLITASNTVVLQRTGYTNLTVTAEQKIDNQVLNKVGSYNATDHAIAYTVNINPNRMDLSALWLTDDLPEGLRLDIDSVKLWKATVDATGKVFTKTDEIVDFEWKYDAGENNFSIKLPAPEHYVLTYECHVIANAKEYTNTITFEGSYLHSGNNSHSSLTHTGGGGGAIHPRTANLKITKQDSKYPHKGLAGVTFQLWTTINSTATLVDEGQTDANGNLTFNLLNPSRQYWLAESQGIPGYDPDTAIVIAADDQKTPLRDYTIPSLTAKQTTAIKIYNDRNTADIEFKKVNKYGWPVDGAVFTLTDAEEDSNLEPKDATSNSDGYVTFSDVPFGSYKLQEKSAPRGYVLSSEVFNVVIDQGGSYTITDSEGQSIFATDINTITNDIEAKLGQRRVAKA